MLRQSPARGFVLRTSCFVVVILMGMASFSLSMANASPTVPAAPITQAPDEASASAAARTQNTRVEVSGRTSETTRVFAEPSGAFTLEQSVMPERVRRGEQWVDVDPTLETRPDGTVAPKAAAADMAFSGGGAKPLATLRQGAGTLALSWRSGLPKPVLSGSIATYAEVLPGVDLRVRANVLGFGHELVVKTRAAAADPALAKVTFGLAATGVTVTVDDAGNARGVDPQGEPLFQAPSPEMWETPAPARGQAEPTPVKRASVGVELGSGQLSLVPDKAFMADPEVGFPVVIDPNWGAVTPARSAWALVRKGLPGQVNLNIEPRDDDERNYGLVRVGRSPDDGANWIDRSYFQFDTTAVKGARINRATLQVYQLWKNAHSCDPAAVAPMELRATAAIGSATSWNNQPWLNPDVFDAVQSVPKWGQPSCGPNWVGLNATRAVQSHADARADDVTLMIKATDADETSANPNSWKRFDSKADNHTYPKLFMEFNHAPLAPVDVKTDPPLPAPCQWCGDVSYVNIDRINLQARLRDPQGGQVMAVWDIAPNDHRELWWPHNEIASTPLVLQHLQPVSWKVRGHDGQLDGPSVDGPAFVVDLEGPKGPPGVKARLYQPDAWHGGVDVPDTFTFTPGGTVSQGGVGVKDADIDRYRYWFTGQEQRVVHAEGRLSGPASVVLTPPRAGPVDLFVQSIDRAGRASETATYHFYVGPGQGPKSVWPLDGTAKDEGPLGGRHGAVEGAVSWTPGAAGAALRLDGSGGHVRAPNTVRTDSSFSVAAWVKLDRTDEASYTAVSQNGPHTCGFCLMYTGDTKSWAFSMPQAESNSQPGWDYVRAAVPPAAGVWTHLAGTYDVAAGEIAFYVNGEFAGKAPRLPRWNASGPVRIGAEGTTGGALTNPFAGAIDEVRLYDRVLTTGEVRALVVKDDVRAGQWRFDDYKGSASKGTVGANEVEGGGAVMLRDGATFTSGGRVGDAIALQSNATAATAGPVMRTDQSFTVAAWMKQDQSIPDGATATAISATGAVNSAFFLGYRSTAASSTGGRWELYVPSADAEQRPADAVVTSDSSPARLGTWTHVVAVYDAHDPDSAKRLKLYVNGALSGTSPRANGFNATGPLLMGRGKWRTVLGNQWTGAVDEVRAYSRAIDAAEVMTIYTAESPAVGSWNLDGTTDDDSGGNRHGETAGAPGWVPGQAAHANPADKAIHLDGVDDYVRTSAPVKTSGSFTVAAWAYVDREIPAAVGAGTVVSQNDTKTPAFALEYTADKRWRFRLQGAYSSTHIPLVELSTEPVAQLRTWTHLTATYDVSAGEVKLLVNGLLATSSRFTKPWEATGEFTIGRVANDGTGSRYFPGAVDAVKVYDRALAQDEASLLAGRDLTLVHHLKLDEASGTTTADSVGFRPGSVAGATFVPGRAGNALKFDSNDDVVTTTAADLRTDDSFSVSAWVNLAQSGGQLTAVSMDGQRTSKFRLGHVTNSVYRQGAWIFEMPEGDTDGAQKSAVVGVLDNEVDKWVHLVGVYDAQAKRIKLHVNSVRVGEAEFTGSWRPVGGLVLGRGKLTGQPAQFWPGLVDDARLYTGRLGKNKIEALYRSYPVPTN